MCLLLTKLSLSPSGQEQTLSLRRSQYIKAKVNTSHHLKKVDDTRGALEKSQRMGAKKEEELAEFHQELQELERAWRDYERHAQEELTNRKADIQLEEEQVIRETPQHNIKRDLRQQQHASNTWQHNMVATQHGSSTTWYQHITWYKHY